MTNTALHDRLAPLADGPTEVHKAQVARALLREATPAAGLFPTEHIPTRLADYRRRKGTG